MKVKPLWRGGRGDAEGNGLTRRNEEMETKTKKASFVFASSFLRVVTVPFAISIHQTYRTVTVTGLNCRLIGAPSGVLATPLTWMSDPPGPTASNTSAARRPAPEAPA